MPTPSLAAAFLLLAAPSLATDAPAPSASWGDLRMARVTEPLAEYLRLPPERRGLAVLEVKEGSPFARAAIRKGDVLLQAGGLPLVGQEGTLEEILGRLAAQSGAGTVKVRLFREGGETEVSVELPPPPASVPPPETEVEGVHYVLRGPLAEARLRDYLRLLELWHEEFEETVEGTPLRPGKLRVRMVAEGSVPPPPSDPPRPAPPEARHILSTGVLAASAARAAPEAVADLAFWTEAYRQFLAERVGLAVRPFALEGLAAWYGSKRGRDEEAHRAALRRLLDENPKAFSLSFLVDAGPSAFHAEPGASLAAAAWVEEILSSPDLGAGPRFERYLARAAERDGRAVLEFLAGDREELEKRFLRGLLEKLDMDLAGLPAILEKIAPPGSGAPRRRWLDPMPERELELRLLWEGAG